MAGRNLEGQYAGFLSRAVGLVLDYVVIMAGVIGVGLVVTLLFNAFSIDLTTCSVSESSIPFGTQVCQAGRWFLGFFAIIFGPFYFLLFWMLTGQTIGQRVMGLRVVRLNGHRLGFWLSLIRWIGYQICVFTLGIGFLWVLIDNRRMGWHDKLARTCVIYAWPAVQHENFISKVNRRFGRRKAKTSPGQVGPDALQDAPTSQEQIAG